MSRQIVLDTETTGLSAENGDRIIELGCVELLNRKLTGNNLHLYLNPERDSHEDALKVHGISNEFLRDKPKFAEVVHDILEYLRGAELIIHNASFDVGFLDNELDLLGRDKLGRLCAGVIDTLKMAKEQNPGKKASLDALCDRYEIDNGHRELHGALLDAELLADVYLAMTRGQESLIMALDEDLPAHDVDGDGAPRERKPIKVLRISDAELQAHQSVLDDIAKANKGLCLWLAPEVPATA